MATGDIREDIASQLWYLRGLEGEWVGRGQLGAWLWLDVGHWLCQHILSKEVPHKLLVGMAVAMKTCLHCIVLDKGVHSTCRIYT